MQDRLQRVRSDAQLVCRLYCPFGRKSGSVTGASMVELPPSE